MKIINNKKMTKLWTILLVIFFLSPQLVFARSYKGEYPDLSGLFQGPKASDYAVGLGLIGASMLVPYVAAPLQNAASTVLPLIPQTATPAFTTTQLLNNFGQGAFIMNMAGATSTVLTHEFGAKPATAALISSIGVGGVVGGLNPGSVLGDSMTGPAMSLGNMAKGAFTGGFTGLVSTGTVVAIDGKKMNKGEAPGVGAQIAGMVAGVYGNQLGRAIVSDKTYHQWGTYRYGKGQDANTQDPNTRIQSPADNVNAGCSGGRCRANNQWDLDQANFVLRDTGRGISSGPQDNMLEAIKPFASLANNTADTSVPIQPDMQANANNSWYDIQETSAQGGIIREQRVDLDPSSVRSVTPNRSGDRYQIVFNKHASAGEVVRNILAQPAINTADAWPMLTSNAVSLAVGNAVGKKQAFLAPLASSVTQGVVSPVLQAAATNLRLLPSYYSGSNKIETDLTYYDNARANVYKKEMSPVIEVAHRVYDNSKGRSLEDFRSELQTTLQTTMDEPRHGTGSGYQFRDENGQMRTIQVEVPSPQAIKDDLYAQFDAKKLSQEEYNMQSSDDNLRKIMFNRAVTDISGKVQASIKQYNSLDDLYQAKHINPSELYLGDMLANVKFGVVEGLVSGGIASLGAKISERQGPWTSAAVMYGASLASAAARGVIAQANYTEPSKFMPGGRFEMYAPDHSVNDDDPIMNMARKDLRRREDMRYAEIASRIGPSNKVRGPNGEEGVRMMFPDDKPNFVAASITQSSYDYLFRVGSFGAPTYMTRDDAMNVSSLASSDYIKQMNNYAMSVAPVPPKEDKGIWATYKAQYKAMRNDDKGNKEMARYQYAPWQSKVLASLYYNAGVSTTSNNIMTGMALSESVADAVGIAPMKMIGTNSPNMPVVFATLHPQPWQSGRVISVFPSDGAGLRALTPEGKSFVGRSSTNSLFGTDNSNQGQRQNDKFDVSSNGAQKP